MQLRGQYAVHFHKDGVLHSFLPGDDVPDWAAKLITNPLAWGADEQPEDAPAPEPATVEVAAGGEGGTPDGAPSKSGVGSSRQAWADYAESKGIEVDPDWKREDIIAAVEKAEA